MSHALLLSNVGIILQIFFEKVKGLHCILKVQNNSPFKVLLDNIAGMKLVLKSFQIEIQQFSIVYDAILLSIFNWIKCHIF